MTARFLMLVGIFAAMLPIGTAADEFEHYVRSSYRGSSDLPDSIAFRQFLRKVKREGHSTDDLVAHALGLPEDGSSFHRISELKALFRATQDEMHDEMSRTAHRMLCSEGRETRSADALYQILNDIDDIYEIIPEKYLPVTLASLDVDERDSFMKFLNDLKAGTSYMKIDNRAGKDDIYQIVKMRCQELASGEL